MSQPEEQLAPFYFPEIDGERGYRPPKAEPSLQAIQEYKPKNNVDPKRYWHYSQDFPVFPKTAAGKAFKQTTEDVYPQLQTIAKVVIERLADYLDLDNVKREHLLKPEGDKSLPFNLVMRSLLYPEFSPKDTKAFPAGTLFKRAAPHTDLGFMTLQLEASGDGLQIKRHGQEHWERLRVPKDLVVVNAGDLLELITKDLPGKAIKATPHRVVANAEEVIRPRVAVPFFVHLPTDKPVINLHNGKQLYREGLEFLFHHNFNADKTLSAEASEKKYQSFKTNYEKKAELMKALSLKA